MKRLIVYIFLLTTFLGCIKNDLPYPVIVPRITGMDVEGANNVNISSEQQSVIITLDETTDIKNVKIKSISFADERTVSDFDTTISHDLSNAITITLSIYQDYKWKIITEQPIERYFTVEGQVGSSEIDVLNRRVITQVNSSVDIHNVTVSSIKLGPKEITTYSPSIAEMKDFANGLDIEVSYHGITEEWSLFVENTTTVVEMKSVNAWTKVAWLSALGVAEFDNGFKYRKEGDSEWIDVPKAAIAFDGGSFSAGVDGLEPLTTYECYAYSGSNQTEVYKFTTEEARQMPNSGFEVFSNAESDKYYSFYNPASSIVDEQTKWWCTGNKGSTTVGSSYSITNPDGDNKVEGKYSVKLQSQYVIVKFAAGNIFVGEFDRVIGTSGGAVNFGRPFTLRPRKLSLWLKYENGPIDRFNGAPDNDPVKEGDMDRCQVFVALGDWDYRDYGGTPDSPVQINTTDKTTFFDPQSDNVIGYGAYVSDKSTDWVKIEIPIEYTSKSRKPTHIIVSAASSMLGDYFTGSTKSTLWIDDMQLEY
ncbi:MAG: PCMD domain-containing protein [Alistipes sp.]|nr:PCMD domain-containing protein [Alistipes sp.]